MKWIFIAVMLVVLPSYAAQQYTESECILLKNQVSDYKYRLGKKSSLFVKANTNFDKHCKSPILLKRKNSVYLTNQKAQTQTPIHTSQNPLASPVEANPKISSTPSPFSQVTSMLMPMFLLLFFGLMALYYFKKKLPQIKGRIGENYVRKGLKKSLDENKYTIINDVTLPLEDGGTTQIDHIVVSTFGVLVIETKNMSGWIFGNERQAKWTQTIHRSKYPFQNPLRQNYKHTKTLALLLDVPHKHFHSIVVFTSNAELKTKMPSNVGHLKEMMVYIKSFEEEIIDHKFKLRILKLLEVIKLDQGRKTNKQHVKYLKEERKGNAAM